MTITPTLHAYRVATGRRIEPFGDLVRDLYVGTWPISRWQEEACRAAGLELEDLDDLADATARPAIVFFDDVFVTDLSLSQFAREVLTRPRDSAIAMPDSSALRAYRVLQDARPLPEGGLVFDVFHLSSPPRADSREALRARCAPCMLATREWTMSVRVPGPSSGGRATWATVAFTDRVVAHVRHWVHLLRLSHLSIGVMRFERLRGRHGLLAWLWLSRGRAAQEFARRHNFVHPSAEVHRTAHLEGAIVGPGSVIRAHAHVHHSVLGANVEVGDHSVLMGCTLADDVQVLRASYFAMCSAMPNGTLASLKSQLSLFGQSVFLTSTAWLLDAKLQGEVRVEHEGEFVSVGTPFLGVCLGHRVTLGSGVTIQAGRAVPSGSTIVAPPETVASSLARHPEGTVLTVRGGMVVPA